MHANCGGVVGRFPGSDSEIHIWVRFVEHVIPCAKVHECNVLSQFAGLQVAH